LKDAGSVSFDAALGYQILVAGIDKLRRYDTSGVESLQDFI
jgi:hypothetical protein